MPRRKVLRLRRLMLLRLAQPAPHRHPRHDRVRRANVVTAEDGRGSSTGCGVHHRARGRAVMVGRRPDAAGCAVSLAPRDILTYPRTSKRDAGRAQDHADRLLLEATLVGLGDLVETRDIVGIAGQDDQHDLARLADGLLAGGVAPLAGGVEHGQPVGKTRRDLVAEELQPLRFSAGIALPPSWHAYVRHRGPQRPPRLARMVWV